MNPGHFAAFAWIPTKTDRKYLSDTLTIYDAGNIQGFLLRESTGKTKWIVFQVDYKLLQGDGVVVEGRTILHETEAPLHYFSIETYPMRSQSQGKFQQLWSLPQTQILVTLSEDPLFSPPQPLVQPRQLPLSPSQPTVRASPESHGPLRSSSSKRADERPQFQHKSKASPMSITSPSSNQDLREPPLLRAPMTQEALLPQLIQAHHIDHESSESPPWTSLAQQSLYSRPPPDLEGEPVGQVSTSPRRTDFQ